MKRFFLFLLIPLLFCGCAKKKTIRLSDCFSPGKSFSLRCFSGDEKAEIKAKMEENETLVLEYENAPVSFCKILKKESCEYRCGDLAIPLCEREAEEEGLRKVLFFLSGAAFEANKRVEKDGAECFVFSFFFDGIGGELLMRADDEKPLLLTLSENGREKSYSF